MNRDRGVTTRRRTKSLTVLPLIALLTLGGCASFSTHQRVTAEPAPAAIAEVVSAVHASFSYDNSRLPEWPPRRLSNGDYQGNCVTFSRLVAQKLRESGFLPRYRNVIAPESTPEHVITVVTDEAGHDWVLDNRYRNVYPAALIPMRYTLEPYAQNRSFGGQRKPWRSARSRQSDLTTGS